jgi:hypothetical protein
MALPSLKLVHLTIQVLRFGKDISTIISVTYGHSDVSSIKFAVCYLPLELKTSLGSIKQSLMAYIKTFLRSTQKI